MEEGKKKDVSIAQNLISVTFFTKVEKVDDHRLSIIKLLWIYYHCELLL
jgi:hypothetical protein